MIVRLTKLIISMACWIIDSLQKIIYKIFGKTISATCVILYYHIVTKDQRNNFIRQMDQLIRRAIPISLAKLNSIEQGVHHVGVTFDDGLCSTVENVLPVLTKRNIPLVVFIPTGCLGQPPGWIKDKSGPENLELVMTAEQLRSLNNRLVSIGSHCITHTSLITLEEDEAKDEIFSSKYELENILGRQVKFLSFPHGAFNDLHVEWARQAGYEHVFSILPTLAVNEYVTGRVRVDPTDWRIEFQLKMLGSYRWLPKAFTLKRKIYSLFRNNY